MKTLIFIICSLSVFVATQWKYVPDKASVTFTVYTDQKAVEAEGVLTGLNGSVTINDTTGIPSSILATIQTKTINSGIVLRDESLKSADFFDVIKYPTITFVSNQIVNKNDSLIAHGKLTIKNVSKQIEICFNQNKEKETNQTLVGNFAINRMDFNVGTKGDGVGNDVVINLIIPITK
jgi:polyisoprenoid-binding protein YceI